RQGLLTDDAEVGRRAAGPVGLLAVGAGARARRHDRVARHERPELLLDLAAGHGLGVEGLLADRDLVGADELLLGHHQRVQRDPGLGAGLDAGVDRLEAAAGEQHERGEELKGVEAHAGGTPWGSAPARRGRRGDSRPPEGDVKPRPGLLQSPPWSASPTRSWSSAPWPATA